MGKVTRNQLDSALSQTLEELGPIILDPLYASASEQEKTLLERLSLSFKTYAFEEILRVLRQSKIQMQKGPLSTMLSRLIEKGIVLKMERGKYRIVNRLFNEFITRQ
jgi:predicted transcriptional regulator